MTAIPLRARRHVALTPSLPLLAVAAFLLTLTAGGAGAQELELELKDGNGKKVAGAEITLTPQGGGDPVSGAANKKGKFEVDLAPGVWDVVVTAPGFGETLAAVEMTEGMTTTATLTLDDEETARKKKAINLFNGAVGKIQSGDEAGALADFKMVTEFDPSISDAHRLVALLAAQSDDLETAGPALATYLEQVPDGLGTIAPAAYMVWRANGTPEQVASAADALRANGMAKDIATKYFNEGVGKIRENDTEGGLALFREAASLAPDLAPAHRSIAAILFNDQNYEEALGPLGQLIVLDPKHKEGLRMAFFSHLELNNASKATEAGAAWAAQAPEAVGEVLQTAQKTFEGNNPEEAARVLGILIGFAADNPDVQYAMGRVLAGKGDIPKAKEHLNKFLELAPDHPEAEAARAMLAGL